jgi:hypothetical protein
LPTPEIVVQKLIVAFQDAAEDDDLDEPGRTQAQPVIDALK